MSPIKFPGLGIQVLVEKSFSIGTLTIAFYGVIIAVGMILGAALAYSEARRTGQKVDDYIDYTIFGIIGAILGARLYYVAFDWDNITAGANGFWETLGAVLNIRGGGLAIYGGVIGAAIVLVVFCRIKKLNVFRFLDTVVFGLLVGQIIGRWGNFFNREAFGCYTFSFFGTSFDASKVGFLYALRMQIPVSDLANTADIYSSYSSMLMEQYGITYVIALPTFLLESIGNLILLILLLIFRDKKKFYGENACRYLVGYGLLRFFLEGFRTDQLKIGSVAVSQILSLVLLAVGLAIIIIRRVQLKGQPAQIDPIPTKEEILAMEAAAKAEEEAKHASRKSAKKEETAENEEATETAEAVEITENEETAETAEIAENEEPTESGEITENEETAEKEIPNDETI